MHDHDNSQGGFWIAPDGASIAVEGPCEHSDTAYRLGLDGYTDAYRKGYLRISTCDVNDRSFSITFSHEHVTVAALRSAVDIARHHARARPHWEWSWESLDWEEDKWSPGDYYDLTKDSHLHTGEDGGDKLARELMQLALAKNAEARQLALALN